MAIPASSEWVIVGEINVNSSEFCPHADPVFRGDVVTCYPISNTGFMAVYLFADGRVETHEGYQGPHLNSRWNRWR